MGTRDAEGVAVCGKDHVGLCGDGDGVVDTADRKDADRASRAVNHLDPFGEHGLDPELKEGVGMAAANFHDLEWVLCVSPQYTDLMGDLL